MKFFLATLSTLALLIGCATHPTTETASNADAAKVCETKLGATAQNTVKVADAKPVDAATCTCTRGKDVRSLKVESDSPKGCKTTYTVGGTDRVIATAVNESGYCKAKSEKVKANLSAAGYTCE